MKIQTHSAMIIAFLSFVNNTDKQSEYNHYYQIQIKNTFIHASNITLESCKCNESVCINSI